MSPPDLTIPIPTPNPESCDSASGFGIGFGRWTASPIGHAAKKNHAAIMQPAPPIADQTRKRPRFGADARHRRNAFDDRERHAPENHVHRVSRRMRLVQRGIEIAQAEREVDGVDVFEGRREKWKM